MALSNLTGTVGAALNFAVEQDPVGLTPTINNFAAIKSIPFTIGVGALQCNQFYASLRTLAASANETLDLNGSLSDLVGNTSIVMVRAKLLFLWLLSAADIAPDGVTVGTAASSILFGNATNGQKFFMDAATDTAVVTNGDFLLATRSDATGWAITNGSTDTVKIVNQDAGLSAIYLIVVGGCAT